MKIFRFMIFIIILMVGLSYGDVTKKMVTQTSFMGTGQLVVTTDSYLKGTKQMQRSIQDFKGKGFLGKMIGKMFRGESGSLVDLEQKKIYNINFEKQFYTTMSFEEMAAKTAEFTDMVEEKTEEAEEDDNVIVIKNEINIDQLNQTKKIAGYDCKGVKITWDYEYKEKDSDEHGAIQASITMWLANEDSKLAAMKSEEMEFGKKYAAALGIDKDFFTENMLGLKFFKMLGKMRQGSNSKAPMLSEEDLNKIKKLKGYPLASEGVFRAKDMSPKNEEMAAEEDEGDVDISKGLGGFFAKKLKKKKEKKSASSDGYTTLFEFKTEVKSFSTNPIPTDYVTIPAGFKAK